MAFILEICHTVLPFSSRLTQTDLSLLTAALVDSGGGGRAVDVSDRSVFSDVLIAQWPNFKGESCDYKANRAILRLFQPFIPNFIFQISFPSLSRGRQVVGNRLLSCIFFFFVKVKSCWKWLLRHPSLLFLSLTLSACNILHLPSPWQPDLPSIILQRFIPHHQRQPAKGIKSCSSRSSSNIFFFLPGRLLTAVFSIIYSLEFIF